MTSNEKAEKDLENRELMSNKNNFMKFAAGFPNQAPVQINSEMLDYSGRLLK